MSLATAPTAVLQIRIRLDCVEAGVKLLLALLAWIMLLALPLGPGPAAQLGWLCNGKPTYVCNPHMYVTHICM